MEKTNTVSKIIKTIALIWGIIGIIYGFYLIDRSDFAIAIIISSFISSIFTFGLGEIIQLLQNIDNNTKRSTNISNDDIPKL
jgi:hypothetical protein